MTATRLLLLLCCLASLTACGGGRRGSSEPELLKRRYRNGESISYRLKGVNKSLARTYTYQARADGVVKKDAAGVYSEEFRWSQLRVDNVSVPLSSASANFTQTLSLDPDYVMGPAALEGVQRELLAPILDLMTFYADQWLAIKRGAFRRQGDHVYVKHGTPNSWADGTRLLLAEDAIDFQLHLTSVDELTKNAVVRVRHVPPSKSKVRLNADWMREPVVGRVQNNWVQVTKNADGKYSAAVGMETFEVELRIGLRDGRIKSAKMDNPVTVRERLCSDDALTDCEEPVEYRTRRQLELTAL
ncbi:MAG: hypothetical protein HYZ75_10765 [Elusimicrobia bacterium]|nr:hypothetical protein [Elusimicrobiota bacterium]